MSLKGFSISFLATLNVPSLGRALVSVGEVILPLSFRFYHKVLSLHEDSATPVSNPLLAFTLIKRLQSDWKNLDSILKSRDITLPTKAHLIKAMVFPGVMYGRKSWTINKAEHRRIDVFELVFKNS